MFYPGNCAGSYKNGKPCMHYPWAAEDRFCRWHDPATYLLRVERAIEWYREDLAELEVKRQEAERKHEKRVAQRQKQLAKLEADRAWCERRAQKVHPPGSQP